MLEKNIYIRIIFTLNTCDMKQLTVVFALLCIFACSREDIVSTVEESVKPANEVAIQTVNLLDSLEIMDYIYSIIGPMAKTRSNLPGGGYILPDNWDSQLTDEQRELIRNSFPRPLFSAERNALRKSFPLVEYSNTVVMNYPSSGYNCFAYSLGFNNKWIEFSTWDQVRYGYENASSVYHAAYDYMKGATSISRYYPVVWGWGNTPLHASLGGSPHCEAPYSKMGRMWLLWHLVSVFSNGMYGVPVETYGAVSPTRSLSEIDANAMKEISEDIHENIIFSPDELMMIARKVKTCRDSSRFESLFNEWKEAWHYSLSNNTATTRNLPQYADLKAMGKEIIPLLIEKMVTEEDNFFAIRLYEDLQDNPNLIIRYANDDPHQLEGLQQTTKKTIKKWLEYNSN